MAKVTNRLFCQMWMYYCNPPHVNAIGMFTLFLSYCRFSLLSSLCFNRPLSDDAVRIYACGSVNVLPWNAIDTWIFDIEYSRAGVNAIPMLFNFRNIVNIYLLSNYTNLVSLRLLLRHDLFFMVRPTLNFWQLIPGLKIIINKFKNNNMMKNKSKKQEDEASTQSNASRYDISFSSLFFFNLSWLFTFTSMVDHLCRSLNHNV